MTDTESTPDAEVVTDTESSPDAEVVTDAQSSPDAESVVSDEPAELSADEPAELSADEAGDLVSSEPANPPVGPSAEEPADLPVDQTVDLTAAPTAAGSPEDATSDTVEPDPEPALGGAEVAPADADPEAAGVAQLDAQPVAGVAHEPPTATAVPESGDPIADSVAPAPTVAPVPADVAVPVAPVPGDVAVPVAPVPADVAVPFAAEPAEPAEPVAPEPVAVPVPAEPEVASEPIDADADEARWPATMAVPVESTGRIDAGPVPVAEREPSPLDAFEPDTRRRRWPRTLAVVGGVVLVLAGAYVAAAYAMADRVAPRTSVAGVQIGGMSRSAAAAALSGGLSDRTSRPIAVAAQGQHASLDPVAAGLAFDPAATVRSLTGVHLTEPVRLWRQVVGGGEAAAVTSVDEAKLSSAVAALADSLHQDPVDGSIVFVDGTPHATDAADGWTLDTAASTQAVAAGWLSASGALTLPTSVVAPEVTQAQTDKAMSSAAVPLSRGPVTVQVGAAKALLSVATLTQGATFTAAKDGSLSLVLNGNGLRDAVVSQLPSLLTPSADAHFDLSSGTPVIVPGAAGTTIDPPTLAAAVLTATSTTARTATVALVATDPAQSTADLAALGVKEVVAEFDTPLTSEKQRTINIVTGAAKITGTLIRPGETFSLAEALGAVDAAHGYVEAGAIVDGQHTSAWGGGLSQVSTTTYNAAFFAGYELVEHKPHSEYFTRYPEGREATIFAPQLDMKWKNNTPYGALVQGWVSGGRVYVQIWSTKYWTVQTTTSPRRGVVAPTTVYDTSSGCEASGAGNPGFSVTVTRTTLLDGAVKKNESWNWTYKPQNRTICSAPPAG